MKMIFIVMVWPEPHSSAAGIRTMQLIEASRSAGHEVSIVSPCQLNDVYEELARQGYSLERLMPNDEQFDRYIVQTSPDIVVFDRFIMEEQFSWRVRHHCSQAVRILDTVDIHSLRKFRQSKALSGLDVHKINSADLQGDEFLREITSIYRSDGALIISSFEVQFLLDTVKVPPSQICYVPYASTAHYPRLNFEERKDFVVIGNFNHPPNADSVVLLKEFLWKKIRAELGKLGCKDAKLHLYGSYPRHDQIAMTDEREGFIVKGWVRDAREVLGSHRINVAPLRFGAGIKGKVVEGWACGTPCIATSIAAEGMMSNGLFGGVIADNWDTFAQQAALVYLDRSRWSELQKNGDMILAEQFSQVTQRELFLRYLNHCVEQRDNMRANNLIGAMMWQQQMRSTEFFSRWIEVKNKKSA